MITTSCPSCFKNFQVPEELLGRRVKCRICGGTFVVEKWPVKPVSDASVSSQPKAAAGELASVANTMPSTGVFGPNTLGDSPPTSVAVESPPSRPARMADVPRPMASEAHLDELVHAVGDSLSQSATEREQPPISRPPRPFGIVWVVFYWIISGLLTIFAGFLFVMATSAAGGVADISSAMSRTRGYDRADAGASVVLNLLQVLACAIFHVGLLKLIACYGLWTSTRWGMTLARVLAVGSAGVSLIFLILSAIAQVGIILSLIEFFTALIIMVYLFTLGMPRERWRAMFLGRAQ